MEKGNIRKFRNHESGCEQQKLYSKKAKHFTKKQHCMSLGYDESDIRGWR